MCAEATGAGAGVGWEVAPLTAVVSPPQVVGVLEFHAEVASPSTSAASPFVTGASTAVASLTASADWEGFALWPFTS